MGKLYIIISMYDIHCHLDAFKMPMNFYETVRNIKGLISSGINFDSWIKNINISKEYPVNLSLGLHPFFAKDNKDELVKLRELLKNNSVVAVGEIGLDYYNDYVIFKNIQKEIFYEQLCFAKKLSLPVIIHCRKAYEDLYKILKQVSVPALVFHSFSGSEQDIIRMNEFNSYFSFGLPITNENNKKHKRLIKLVPKEKILLETDSPFMKAKDAMCSYPADIINVYNASSDILGISLEDLLSQIERNVKSIWKDFRELSP